MSFPRITDGLGTVSTLDDRPNDTSGLTASELKAKFDKDPETLKAYINDIFIPYLESTAAAAQLGVATIPGFSASDIQTALEQLAQAMQDVTQGSVSDGSITLVKLAAEVTAVALGGAAAEHTHAAADVVSGTLELSRLPVLDAAHVPVLGADNLGAGSVATEKLAAAAVTAEKLAALAVLSTHISPGAVTAQKLAADAVKLTFTNVELPVSWMATSERYADDGFPYFGAIPLTGATTSMTPEVVFSVADAMSGIFAPVAETYDGGVYIYASELPSATTITIPTIILWR